LLTGVIDRGKQKSTEANAFFSSSFFKKFTMDSMAVFDRLSAIFLEPSTILLVMFVVWLLALSCYRSQSFASVFHQQIAEETESSVSIYAAIIIPVVGSLVLLALFFFLNIVFYFLVLLFSISSFFSVSLFVQPSVTYLRRRFLGISDQQTITFRGKAHTQAFFDIIVSAIFGVLGVVLWLVTRHWIMVDLLAMCLASEAVKTLRLPNLMVGAVFLSIFLLYDLFWVFLSPLLFHGKSVMVEVAVGVTSGSIPLPMLFMIPKFRSDNFSMLGLGDVVLPGLLLGYLFRVDYEKASKRGAAYVDVWDVLTVKNGYFSFCLFGYTMGLLITFTMLAILQMGQPALIYLVPTTLGPCVVLALFRGEFRELWKPKVKVDDDQLSPDEENPSPIEMQTYGDEDDDDENVVEDFE
jgi:signal peptide peptidase-like protein 2B